MNCTYGRYGSFGADVKLSTSGSIGGDPYLDDRGVCVQVRYIYPGVPGAVPVDPDLCDGEDGGGGKGGGGKGGKGGSTEEPGLAKYIPGAHYAVPDVPPWPGPPGGGEVTETGASSDQWAPGGVPTIGVWAPLGEQRKGTAQPPQGAVVPWWAWIVGAGALGLAGAGAWSWWRGRK